MFQQFSLYYQKSSDENKLLVLVLLIISALSLLFTVYAFMLESNTFILTGLTAMLTPLLAVALLYSQKITYDKTSYIIVAAIFILLLLGFISTANKIEATLYLVSFPVILIALRPDHEWAFVMFTFIVIIIGFQIFGLTAATYNWGEMIHIWLTLGLISLFLGFYVLMSRETKKQLAVEQKKLETINNSLEEKVRVRTIELQRLNDKLALDITIDPVTKIMNKRTFMEKLRTQIERFKHDKTHFSILIFDLDDFHQLNHSYGRKKGDEILAKIAQMTSQNSRTIDIVARIAGDEFAIIMHDASYEEALARAEKIRQNIEWAVYVDTHHITASFGVVEFEKPRADMDEHIVLHELDLALQKSKHRGKNRIC